MMGNDLFWTLWISPDLVPDPQFFRIGSKIVNDIKNDVVPDFQKNS